MRLKKHGLLDMLPADLQTYLAHRTAANRVRNHRLKNELASIIALLAAKRIPVLLLKGAATFTDRLYADDGARLMQDLDLLIPEDQVERAQRILIDTGYTADPASATRHPRFPLIT